MGDNTDPLTWNVPIVDGGGRPTNEFMRKWEQQQSANGNIPATADQVSALLDKLAAAAGDILVRGTLKWAGLASPNDAAKFLNGAVPPAYARVQDTDLSMADVTGNNVSTLMHGFAPKAPNDATKYLDGTGAYSVPAGGGGSGFDGWFINPPGGHAVTAGGPAYNYTLIYVPAGYTVRGTAFRPLATNGTITYGSALYAQVGGTSAAPGALLASAASVVTGTTAGVLTSVDFSTPYTALTDQLLWASLWVSAGISVAQSVGESAYRTSSSTWPPPNPALGITVSTTYTVAAYGDPP